LFGVVDEFGACGDVLAAEADLGGVAFDEVEFPAAAAGGEEGVLVAGVADGLPGSGGRSCVR
jgi:hypothetical protein